MESNAPPLTGPSAFATACRIGLAVLAAFVTVDLVFRLRAPPIGNVGPVTPPACRVSSITVHTEPANLATLRELVSEVAASCGADVDTIDDIRLVVSELATNVIQHTSSRTITVGFEFADDVIVVGVLDAEGLESTMGRAESVRADTVTGRGLCVVRALMDTVELVENDGAASIRYTKGTRT